MIFKKTILLLFLLASLSMNSFAQIHRKYQNELKFFLLFVHDSIFTKFKNLVIYPYLSNKDMFQGTVLYSEPNLTAEEIKLAANEIKFDTSIYFISSRLLKRAKFVENTDKKNTRLSKPIFLRNYEMCLFSFSVADSEVVFLCKKEKGKWRIIKKLGGVSSI